MAPGTQRTLDQLRDPVRRPTTAYAPLPQALLNHHVERQFLLDKTLFLKNVKRARRGAAAGPSGVTAEHVKPVLNDSPDSEKLFAVALLLARASVPQEVLTALRMGRLTALQKPNGSVRGIVASDVFRRLVARTMAQQLGPAIERATSPFQYALSTRAGTECIAHAIQGLTDLDEAATVVSIDGIGAFDVVSRRAMLEGLQTVEGGDSVMPFVLQFYGSASSYLWEDQEGVVHTIVQAEGGEQGDPLMPALFSLGQHPALQVVQSQLQDGERLFAFLDDVYIVCAPPRVNATYAILQRELFTHSSIRVFHGKTQVWNRGSVAPPGIEVLQAVARVHDPDAREDGAALRAARRRKERVYPELSGAHGRARLVVLAGEVGGRWSSET